LKQFQLQSNKPVGASDFKSLKQSHNKQHFTFDKVPRVQKGHVVAQLFEARRYKPEGRGFDSRWCHWNFSLT